MNFVRRKAIQLCVMIFGILPLFSFGQKLEVIANQILSHTAEIDLAQGELKSVNTTNGINLRLEYGQMHISYSLPTLEEEGRYYQVIPSIQFNGKELPLILFESLRGDWGQDLNPGKKEIIWINLIQEYKQLEGDIRIDLEINQWGQRKLPYNCDLGQPEFTSRQKLPYYLAAGVAAASIGVGQLFKNQSQDIYSENYLTASSFAEASPFYEDANNKHQTYLLLTYAGVGILVADITLFSIRQHKYKRSKKLYDEYCEDRLGNRNGQKLNFSSGIIGGAPGMKLTYHF
ncbi:MAG TPA: hypothetical protein VJ917_03860 [Saprospiraceae bacterium]|nr:hypothetical protein [Saprospiraceae bacterium]